MEKHMYRSALAFKKELEQGFQPSFAFPHFEALVVIFLYREWRYRHRSESTVCKVELRKMLAIIKADQRRHPKGKGPFESPWEVFLYMYSESIWDFHWDEIESWVQQNWTENGSVTRPMESLAFLQFEADIDLFVFKTDNIGSKFCSFFSRQNNESQYLCSLMFFFGSKVDTINPQSIRFSRLNFLVATLSLSTFFPKVFDLTHQLISRFQFGINIIEWFQLNTKMVYLFILM